MKCWRLFLVLIPLAIDPNSTNVKAEMASFLVPQKLFREMASDSLLEKQKMVFEILNPRNYALEAKIPSRNTLGFDARQMLAITNQSRQKHHTI
jgi:hypothetical protein